MVDTGHLLANERAYALHLSPLRVLHMQLVKDMQNWPDGAISAPAKRGENSIRGLMSYTECILKRQLMKQEHSIIIYSFKYRSKPI